MLTVGSGQPHIAGCVVRCCGDSCRDCVGDSTPGCAAGRDRRRHPLHAAAGRPRGTRTARAAQGTGNAPIPAMTDERGTGCCAGQRWRPEPAPARPHRVSRLLETCVARLSVREKHIRTFATNHGVWCGPSHCARPV